MHLHFSYFIFFLYKIPSRRSTYLTANQVYKKDVLMMYHSVS